MHSITKSAIDRRLGSKDGFSCRSRRRPSSVRKPRPKLVPISCSPRVTSDPSHRSADRHHIRADPSERSVAGLMQLSPSSPLGRFRNAAGRDRAAMGGLCRLTFGREHTGNIHDYPQCACLMVEPLDKSHLWPIGDWWFRAKWPVEEKNYRSLDDCPRVGRRCGCCLRNRSNTSCCSQRRLQ